MIFNELSNAFFRFSLRQLGAELEGGGGRENIPRPEVIGEEQRPGAG